MAYTQEQLKAIQAQVAQQTGQTVPLSDIQTLVSNPEALNRSNAVWTGAGWENRLPQTVSMTDAPDTFAVRDAAGSVYATFATQDEAEQWMNSSAARMLSSGDYGGPQGALSVEKQAGQKGGMFDEASYAAMLQFGDKNLRPEFHRNPDGSYGEFAGFTVKSGDKQGTIVPYIKNADGTYSPDYSGQQDVSWNTTNRKYGLMVVGAIAAAAAAAGAGLLGSAAQSAVTPAAAGAESAAAAGTAATGGGSGLFESAYGITAADTAAASAPASAWGTTGAAYVPGTYAGTAGAGVVAGEGGMATLGSAAGALAGSLPSSVVDAVNTAVNTGQSLESVLAANGISASALQPATGGTSIADLLKKGGSGLLDYLKANPGLLDTVVGAIGADRGEQATDDLLAERIKQASDYKQAGLDYSEGLLGLLSKYGDAYKPRYATVDNGFATSNIDPATGKVSTTLSEPYQGLFSGYTSGAQSLLDQVNAYSTDEAAKKYFDNQQALLAAGDQKAEQGLLQSLYQKGGYGLMLNTPTAASTTDGTTVTAGTGTTAVNPYVSTFLNERNARDANIAASATDQAQQYLSSLINQAGSLTGQANTIQNNANNALTTADTWSDQFMSDAQRQANFGLGLEKEALGSTRDATQDYIKAILGANTAAIGSDAASQAGLIEAILKANQGSGSSSGNWLTNLPWGDVAGWLKSLA